MALHIEQRRSLISTKLAGAFLAVFALFVQPLVTLNIPAAFAAGIPGQIVVNEFSSATAHDDWVELYNTSGSPTNLTNWKLKDSGGNEKPLSGTVPGHSWTSFDLDNALNASGDTIVVEDDAGVAIDIVAYGTAGSVPAPSATQFAARTTDNSATWELRAISSRDATNNAGPAVEENMVCATGCEYTSLAAAVAGEAAGSTITVKAGTNLVITSTILVNKPLTITGQSGATITTSGSNKVLTTTAPGVTISNLTFVKTDKANQNIINIQGANTTVSGNDFSGQYTLAANDHTSRALEISTTSGLNVTGNTFNNLRQPAYINDNTTGTITNNHVHETRGWVAVANTQLTFSDNTWGTNAVDIAFIPGTPNNYSCEDVTAIRAANNNAEVQNQAQTTPCPEACNGSGFDNFTLGSVNGQSGWKSTGSYDQEVVSNVYGYDTLGCKSLRISNAVTSGAFGNQTFSAPAASLAGEGVTNDRYEATFDVASTQASQQTGLALSVSPDDGNGNRMSYLRFEDQNDGLHVFFDDYTTTWNDTEIAVLSRSQPHAVKIVIDFKDGASNDVVKVYIDGTEEITGTTWENYYRYDPEQAGNGNIVPNVDRLLFRAAGTAAPANDGKGYLFDNVSVTTSQNDGQAPDVTFVTPSQNDYVQNLKVDVDMDGTGSNLIRYGFDVTGPNGLSFSTHNYNVDQPTVELDDFNLCAAQNYGDDCPAQLPNGLYTIRAKAYDKAGNRNISTTLKITVDTVKPKATLKSSSVGSVSQKILKEADFSLSDNYKVRAYIINGTRVTVSPNKWSDANDIKVGARHGVYGENTIEVEDMAGNVSDPFTFTLDNVEPTISVKDSSIGDENAKIFSNISFSLYDLYKVDKYVVNGHVSDFTDNKWSDANFQNIKAYLHQGSGNELVLHDVAGNSKTYTFTYDTVAPTATFTHSNNNDNTLVNTDVTSTLHASEPIHTPSGWTKVDDVTFTKVSTANNKGNMTITDVAGNSGSVFFEVKRIDKTNPTFNITNGAVLGSSSVEVIVTEENIDKVFVDSPTTSTPHAGTKPNYTVTVTGEGVHTVRATDKAGNEASVSFTIDTTAPVLTSLTAVQNDNNTFTLSVVTNDVAPVVFRLDGTELSGVTSHDNGNGTWTWTVLTGVLPVNTNHTFSAASTDNINNSSTTTGTLSVEPPETSTLGDDSTTINRQLTGATTVPTASLFATTNGAAESDDNEAANEGEVLGTQDSSSPAENVALAPSDQGWKLWGIAWYWWLLAAAVLAGIWWLIAAWRRRQAEADPSAGL